MVLNFMTFNEQMMFDRCYITSNKNSGSGVFIAVHDYIPDYKLSNSITSV